MICEFRTTRKPVLALMPMASSTLLLNSLNHGCCVHNLLLFVYPLPPVFRQGVVLLFLRLSSYHIMDGLSTNPQYESREQSAKPCILLSCGCQSFSMQCAFLPSYRQECLQPHCTALSSRKHIRRLSPNQQFPG